MTLAAGDRLAERYRLVKPLGSGAMASVFLAQDERSHVTRVLKQLRLDEPALLAAFRQEFALLSRLTHPHLIRVHDFGTWRVRGERYHYYTADWVEGEPLSRWALRGKADCSRPAIDALSALAALHAVGVRHGDISPENVLVRKDGSGVLIDLGCAQPIGLASGTVAGTPGFIAPELLTLAPGDARSDLYALGQTLRWAHEAADVPLSGKLKTLCDRLSAADPAARPSSAREALELLGRAASRASAVGFAAKGLVGRQAEISEFQAWLAQIHTARPGARVLWLSGESGVGTSRLLRELVSLAELEVDVLRAHADEQTPVTWLVTSATGSAASIASVRDVLHAATELAQGDSRLLLVLEDAHRLEPEQAELLAVFLRALPEAGNVGCLISSCEAAPLGARQLRVSPLSLPDLCEWTSDTLSRGRLSELYERTQGYPARIEAALLGAEPSAQVRVAGANRELGQLIGTSDEKLRHSLAVLVALGGEADWNHPCVESEALEPLFGKGWLRRDGARVALRNRGEQPHFEEALRQDLPRAHRSLAEWYASAPNLASETRLAEEVYHLARAGDGARALGTLQRAEPLWRERPRSVARRLRAIFEQSRDASWLVLWAELALLAGDFAGTLRATARVLRLRRSDDVARRCRLLAADALLRSGQGRRVERLLQSLARETSEPVWRAEALERCARAHLQISDVKACERAAEEGLRLAVAERNVRALRELSALAASYLGRTEEAVRTFSELLASETASSRPRDRSRLLAQRAIALFRAGRAADAIADYREALEVADRHGLDDLVCVNSLNLGTAQQKLGDWGGALASYERGLRVAYALGRESSELTLRFNLANLLAEIGDFTRAGSELDALERRSANSGRAHYSALIALLRAEIGIERGTLDDAEHELARARSAFEAAALPRESCEVEICEAELALARSDTGRASNLARQTVATARRLNALDLELRGRAALARAEIATGVPGALQTLGALLDEAETMGERSVSARLCSYLYRAELEAKVPNASQRAARAQRLWDQLGSSLPQALRETFWADSRRAAIAERTRIENLGSGASADTEALRKLLSLSRRVNSSLSLERVFEYAVDAALELTSAERCFLLLDEAGVPSVVAQRPSGSDLLPPSRAIVERVIASDEAVLTTDAQTDQRFSAPGSIHSLKLKSVLCVPILTPAARIGLIYIDSRVQRARFQERERELLSALADQVAVAVSNARMHRDLERQREELAEQKRLVERLSRAKDRELEKLRERVEEQQRTLGLRYDYSRIIGRGAAMRKVFEQLDRITDSSVDVLIQGESGTGKELVARALHQNGPRKQAHFVGINCAALPENLLESELFGHVRGAFTGADRDKRGLVLEANGGTLFLDEVGELPLSMQAKLLRVLQEREVRAVGALRGVNVDVRVVSATHRDLRALVADGRFREDLYYRLAVVSVTLPPLRERSEDLPLLAASILERLSREAGVAIPKLTPEALRRLAAHPFPGNVRELENTLTRAFVFRKGNAITGADLELTERAPRRNSKSRREYQVEEREQIVQALRRTHWNVSLVSRELGIPRNTLYRKLRRYGLDERPNDAES
jgi:transcriptional regulator with GAF, ATPase, and Fis domain